jgi:hypothetical protein
VQDIQDTLLTPAADPQLGDSIQEMVEQTDSVSTDTVVSRTDTNPTPVDSTKPDTFQASSPIIQPEPVRVSEVVEKTTSPAVAPFAAQPQDSLRTLTTHNDTLKEETTSSFYDGVNQPRKIHTAGWEIFALLAVILLLAFINAFHKKKLEALMKAFVNSRVVPLQLREENVLTNRAVLLLSLAFVVVFAVFIFQLAAEWQLIQNNNGLSFFLQAALFILLVYVAKFAVFELLAEVFDQQAAVREYLFTVVIVNVVACLVVIPFVASNALSLHLGKPLLVAALLLVGMMYLYRNWRAFKISLTYQFPVYYIFLYLCTLEILPAIVLVKLLQAQLH